MPTADTPRERLLGLEETYRVWWAYLLYCEPFREVIRVSLHQGRRLRELTRPAMRASNYSDPWIHRLLPDLFNRYPTMADFPRVWHRVEVLARVWNHNIATETEFFKRHLSNILHRVQHGDLNPEQAAALITAEQIFCIPRRMDKADALWQIEQLLPDDGEPRLDGTPKPIRFHLPTHLGHNATRPGSLNTLKKNLTWYVLSLGLKTDEDWSNLYDGRQVRYWLPDGEAWTYEPVFSGSVNFTDTPVERIIADRWAQSPPPESTIRHRYTRAARQRQRDIADFRKWALTCSSEAGRTLDHVSRGWFPRPPKKNKKSSHQKNNLLELLINSFRSSTVHCSGKVLF